MPANTFDCYNCGRETLASRMDKHSLPGEPFCRVCIDYPDIGTSPAELRAAARAGTAPATVPGLTYQYADAEQPIDWTAGCGIRAIALLLELPIATITATMQSLLPTQQVGNTPIRLSTMLACIDLHAPGQYHYQNAKQLHAPRARRTVNTESLLTATTAAGYTRFIAHVHGHYYAVIEGHILDTSNPLDYHNGGRRLASAIGAIVAKH